MIQLYEGILLSLRPPSTRVLVFIFLLAATPALGQQKPDQPVGATEGARVPDSLRLADIKLGPFYIQPRLGIQNLGYDSNVVGASKGSGQKESDFRASPLAGIRFFLPVRARHVFSGDGALVYQWYKDLDRLRGFNTALEGRYEFDSHRLGASVTYRYVTAQNNQLERIDLDSGPTTPDSEIFFRVRTRTSDVQGELQWNLTLRTFVGGRGGRRIVRYEDSEEFDSNLSDELDRTENSIGGFVGMQLRPSLKTRLFYDYREDDFENPASRRNVTTYRTGVEFEWDTTGRLSGLLRLGYRDLTPEAGFEGFTGLVVDASVSTTLGGVFQLQLLGNRDTVASFWGDNAFFRRQGGGLDVLFRVNRRLALGGRATAYRHDYFTETTFPLLDGSLLTAKREDTIYRFEGTIAWRVGGQEIQLRTGYYERISNYDTQEQNGLIVSTGYVTRF